MNVPTTSDAAAWLGKYLEGAHGDTDLAQAMLAAFAEALMSAEASVQCGAAYGERTPERENSRNGYHLRPWDTRVGSIELAVPKLRRGVYNSEFLLQPRRRAEQALVAVVCAAYVEGISTRRVDNLVKAMGSTDLEIRGLPQGGQARLAERHHRRCTRRFQGDLWRPPGPRRAHHGPRHQYRTLRRRDAHAMCDLILWTGRTR